MKRSVTTGFRAVKVGCSTSPSSHLPALWTAGSWPRPWRRCCKRWRRGWRRCCANGARAGWDGGRQVGQSELATTHALMNQGVPLKSKWTHPLGEGSRLFPAPNPSLVDEFFILFTFQPSKGLLDGNKFIYFRFWGVKKWAKNGSELGWQGKILGQKLNFG